MRAILRETPDFGPDEIEQIKQAIVQDRVGEVREETTALQTEIEAGNASDTSPLRAGVACYWLGQHQLAADYLGRASGEPLARFYRALSCLSLNRLSEAEQEFEEAARLGYDAIECTLRRAGVLRSLGRLDEAEKLLRSVASKAVSRAEYSYQMGGILADRNDPYGAVEYFERAVDMDPQHSRALFALAGEHSLRGNDEEAIRLYERSLAHPPQYLGAFLNLGLLYEDAENYAAAAYCFRRILDVQPAHPRAALYLKDIEATTDMYYDEEAARSQMRLQQLLARPVSDFELTVRSRNCLAGMNIQTLGDLTRISEQELLSEKNFGETSLTEIEELLASFGLRIGQHSQATMRGAAHAAVVPPPSLSPQETAVLSKPVTELNLSVRARKCMMRLGIATLGELVQRTADELLSSKNFGVTSLNEVRSGLAEFDLRLRND
jgi:DNA-directed RNA polymerase subunit alpha